MTLVDFWRIVCLVWSFLKKKMTKKHASNESKWCNHDSSWFRWLIGCIQATQSESSKFQWLVQEVSVCVNYLYSIKLLYIYITIPLWNIANTIIHTYTYILLCMLTTFVLYHSFCLIHPSPSWILHEPPRPFHNTQRYKLWIFSIHDFYVLHRGLPRSQICQENAPTQGFHQPGCNPQKT